MTYSRPTTSTVNALSLPTPFQPLSAPGRQEVSVTPNGRLFDNTNPAQAGANAGKDAAAIGSFLSSIIKPGAEIYKGYLQEQGNTQAGEFLQKVNVESLYAAGNEDQRNMLRSLNPFAQEAVQQAAARGSVRSYMEMLAVNRASNKLLSDPNATGEQVAKAEASAKRRALDGSGLVNLPPGLVAQFAPSLAEAEAGLRGETYKARYANQVANDENKLREGFQSDFVVMDTNRRRSLLSLQQTGSGDEVKKALADNVKWAQGNLDDQIKGGLLTAEKVTELYWGGMSAEIKKRSAANDFDGLESLFEVLGKLVGTEVKAAGGPNIWAIPLGGGGSVKERLDDARASLRPAMQEWEQKQLVASFGEDMVLAAQGDPSAMLRATSRLGELTSNPAALREVVSTMGQVQAFHRTPTDAQLATQEQLTVQMNDPNRDRRSFASAINASNMTLEQKIRMQSANTQPTDPIIGLVSTAGNYAGDELNQAASYIFQGLVKSGKYAGKMDADSVGAEVKRIALDLRIKVTKATEAGIRASMDSGKDVGSSDALAIYREQLTKTRDGEFQKLKVDPPTVKSPSAQVVDDFNFAQDKLYQTRGVPTIGAFSPRVIAASKAAGIPQDYRNVSRFFMTQLRAARDANGKPMFPEPDKMWQQVVEQSKRRPQVPGRAPTPASRPSGGWEPSPQSPAKNGFESLYRMLNPEPAPLPPKGKGGGPTSSAKSGGSTSQAKAQDKPLAVQLLAKGLEIIGGAIAAPASAAEFPGGEAPRGRSGRIPMEPMRNAEALPELAALWRGHQAMGPRTPALPQLAANMPAQPVGMAISSDRHPIFLAIGIAEGTRTASGGYTQAYYGHTDPADGNNNAGTVSGGGARGGGGSPQAVDRKWMGVLTQKQMQVAPLLQRLGVPANSVAYNRLMFNALDLAVQAPLTFPDFLRKLPAVIAQGMTIEAIAKARADSYINPSTGRLEAGGFGNNYSRLLADQRSRAGAFDYKRRL
jgi:hypothetical protein